MSCFYPTLFHFHKGFFFQETLYTFSIPYFCAHHKWLFFPHYYEQKCCLSAQTVGNIWQSAFWWSIKYLHNSLFIIVLWKSEPWWLSQWNIYPSHAVSAVLLWDYTSEGSCQRKITVCLDPSIQPWSVSWTLWKGLRWVHVVEEK